MVLCVKVPLKKAQDVKRFLIDNDLFNPDYILKKDGEYILFPISKKTGIQKRFSFVTFPDIRCMNSMRKKQTLKSEISKVLTKSEREVLKRAFDVTGSIAIIEIPEGLEKKEILIAESLLKLHKNISTVLKKVGIHGTEFRTQKMKYLSGRKTKEALYVEHGVRLKLDVEKVYFSPRLSTERKRIADQVKPGESVLIMFSGCAPYPCVIARRTKAKDITGIELNPYGHKYGLENVKLNKISNVTLINGDVKEVVQKLKQKFDRIAMPLPKSAGDFLSSALAVARKGTIIHFYAFEDEGNFTAAHERIKEACKKNKMKCKILKTVKCGQHSPSNYRICVDFKVL
ncbi:MAG: class I SAM-dependent methyltransferase family protein [Candidatus Woesearchaeota archaeon]